MPEHSTPNDTVAVAGTGEAEVPLDAPVTVVGGGLTGIENAAGRAEQGRAITLVCGTTLAPTFGAPGRRSIAGWLSRHGVAVLENDGVAEVQPDALGRLLTGETLTSVDDRVVAAGDAAAPSVNSPARMTVR